MFNEHGMTSRRSFSSRLYVDLEEGSANPASSKGEVWQSFPGQWGPCAGQTSWHSKNLLLPCLPPADAPCASLGKAPRSCDRSGTCWQRGGLAACLTPAWSTQLRSPAPRHLARGSCSIQGTGKVSAQSSTSQPLPHHEHKTGADLGTAW